MNTKVYAIVALIIATIIRGSTFLVIKNTVSIVDPVFLLALRFTIAALILFLYIYFKKGFSGFQGDWKPGLILGVCFIGLYISQTVGLQFTSASNSGFITGMFLLFTPMFAYLFFKRNMSYLDMICISITLLGLYLLTGGVTHFNNGDIITLITAFFFALHMILAEKYLKTGSDLILLNFQQFLTTGLACFILSYILGTVDFSLSGVAYSSILYLAFFGSIIAYGFQFFGQKEIISSYAGIILSLEPVFAFLFAITLGGEFYSMTKILGGLCIVFAMMLPEFIALYRK